MVICQGNMGSIILGLALIVNEDRKSGFVEGFHGGLSTGWKLELVNLHTLGRNLHSEVTFEIEEGGAFAGDSLRRFICGGGRASGRRREAGARRQR